MNLQKFLDFVLRRRVGHVLSQFTALEQKLLAAAERERERTKVAAARAKIARHEAEALAALSESDLAQRVATRVRALLD